MTEIVSVFRWRDAVDIAVVAVVVYRILLMFKGTRAVQMIKQVVTALKMVPVFDAVSIPFVMQFIDDEGEVQANEVMAGKPTYTVIVSSNYPVGGQVDQVQVQVSVSAAVSVYNRYTASHMAAQLLNEDALQTLGGNYQPQGMPFVATPRVVQQGKNGLVYLSVSAQGLWVYAFSPQQVSQWRQSIKGATPALALAYLNAQPGVVAVRIQLPFGADHLPLSVDQIKVVLVD